MVGRTDNQLNALYRVPYPTDHGNGSIFGNRSTDNLGMDEARGASNRMSENEESEEVKVDKQEKALAKGKNNGTRVQEDQQNRELLARLMRARGKSKTKQPTPDDTEAKTPSTVNERVAKAPEASEGEGKEEPGEVAVNEATRVPEESSEERAAKDGSATKTATTPNASLVPQGTTVVSNRAGSSVSQEGQAVVSDADHENGLSPEEEEIASQNDETAPKQKELPLQGPGISGLSGSNDFDDFEPLLDITAMSKAKARSDDEEDEHSWQVEDDQQKETAKLTKSSPSRTSKRRANQVSGEEGLREFAKLWEKSLATRTRGRDWDYIKQNASADLKRIIREKENAPSFFQNPLNHLLPHSKRQRFREIRAELRSEGGEPKKTAQRRKSPKDPEPHAAEGPAFKLTMNGARAEELARLYVANLGNDGSIDWDDTEKKASYELMQIIKRSRKNGALRDDPLAIVPNCLRKKFKEFVDFFKQGGGDDEESVESDDSESSELSMEDLMTQLAWLAGCGMKANKWQLDWDYVEARATAELMEHLEERKKAVQDFDSDPLKHAFPSEHAESFEALVAKMQSGLRRKRVPKPARKWVSLTSNPFTASRPATKARPASASGRRSSTRLASNLTADEEELAWLLQESRFIRKGSVNQVDWNFVVQHGTRSLQQRCTKEAENARWNQEHADKVEFLVRAVTRGEFEKLSRKIHSRLLSGYRREHMAKFLDNNAKSHPTEVAEKRSKVKRSIPKQVHKVGDIVMACQTEAIDDEEWLKAEVKGLKVTIDNGFEVRYYTLQFLQDDEEGEDKEDRHQGDGEDGQSKQDDEEEKKTKPQQDDKNEEKSQTDQVIHEAFVKTPEDFHWLDNHSEDELKGIVRCSDPRARDKYNRLRGWYETCLTGRNPYVSLCAAMRAYDDALVEEKGALSAVGELNLPEDWIFQAGKAPVRKTSKVAPKERDLEEEEESSDESSDDSDSSSDDDDSDDDNGNVQRKAVSSAPINSARAAATRPNGGRSAKRKANGGESSWRPWKRLGYSSLTAGSDAMEAAPMPAAGGHEGYVSLLHSFEVRSEERWEDFQQRAAREKNKFSKASAREGAFQEFANAQMVRWDSFVEEEAALLKWNTSRVEDLVTAVAGGGSESFSPKYVSSVERYVSRRQERLEDCCKRLQQDARKFWSGTMESFNKNWDDFVERQDERWRYFKHSEEAVMKLHICQCEDLSK